MFAITCVCVYTFAIISQSSGSNNLPSFVTTCKRSNENISECMKSNIERLRQYSDVAFPEFNISRLDPWESPANFAINKETIYTNVSNVEFTGSKNFKVTGISVSIPTNIFNLKLRFPKLRHTCTVAGKGSFLKFKLGTRGSVSGYSDLTLCMKLKGKRIFKNEKEYISFDDVVVTARGENFYAEAYDLVVGTPEENAAFRTIFVDYRNFFSPLYNYFAKMTIGNDVANVIRNVYKTYPLDELHPLN